MKYLILALLVAFSLPAMATIHLNSSRSNVVEEQDAQRKSQTIYQGDVAEKAIIKSKSNITNNRENSAVEYKDGEDGVNRKGKPSKDQVVPASNERSGTTVRGSKSNSSDRTTINGSKSNSYRLEGGKNDGDKAITFGRDQLKGSTKNSGHAVEK